jgi:alkylation response protein AidB-like acyl-CoA dehydrogenase
MAAGQDVWAQAWSEPNAGSDMAAIRSKAVDDGDDWIVTGQKIWASRAVWSDWCFGIFRTDPNAERHRGLTFILSPLDSPGITVRPIAQLDGDTGFAEIFFDEVRVSKENTLGPVNQGWSVAMATAGFERGISLRSPARFSEAANRLIGLWRAEADPDDDALRDSVVSSWMEAEGYRLHTYMTVSSLLDGGTIGAEASLNKIFWSEMDLRLHERALDILGPRAEPLNGPYERWLDGFLFSLSGPIYAGTNEIQRNIIADRVLKLPKGL